MEMKQEVIGCSTASLHVNTSPCSPHVRAAAGIPVVCVKIQGDYQSIKAGVGVGLGWQTVVAGFSLQKP